MGHESHCVKFTHSGQFRRNECNELRGMKTEKKKILRKSRDGSTLVVPHEPLSPHKI